MNKLMIGAILLIVIVMLLQITLLVSQNTDSTLSSVSVNTYEYYYSYDKEKNVAEIQLYTEIYESYKYKDLYRFIDSLPEHTKIKFYTGGYGGSVDTLVTLLSLLKERRQDVTVIVLSPAYSAHAYLMCASDKVIINPGAMAMFHGVQFKTPDPSLAELYNKKIVQFIVLGYCQKILTKEEINILTTTGSEIYIDSDELARRVNQ